VKRYLFDDDHEAFRVTVRDFYVDHVVPEYTNWERERVPPRHFWKAAGKLGLLGIQVPKEYGGAGRGGFLFNVILTEESRRAGIELDSFRMHTDITMPYFLRVANAEQQSRWLPRLVGGDAVAALATADVGAGCDDKALTVRAIRDGRSYIVYGSRTLACDGADADLIVTPVTTNPAAGRDGLSLLVVDGNSPRLTRGPKLDKVGPRTRGLAKLIFDDVVVPAENLLGEEGRGLSYLIENVAQERLSIAVNSHATAVKELHDTIEYAKDRKAFGAAVSSSQQTKFLLATCVTDIEAGQSLLDRALVAHENDELSAADAAIVKLFCTEMRDRVVDSCLQLHGDSDHMPQFHPIFDAYADAGLSPTYGASSEVMKLIIAQSLGV
jgi:alkylation response protein AidB-like acyl-CoA dehydrogenase